MLIELLYYLCRSQAKWGEVGRNGGDLRFCVAKWGETGRAQAGEVAGGRGVRRWRTPGERATARVGELGPRRPGARESWAHAQQVWEAARRAVVSRAATLEVLTRTGGEEAFHGQLDLVLVSALAGHLSDCELCWRRWVDGYRPGDLITGSVKRRPAGEILRATEIEMKARRRARERDERRGS
jgi:hypothetical protein